MYPVILCMIKDLSALDVRPVPGQLNPAKKQELAAGGGKHPKKNVDCTVQWKK